MGVLPLESLKITRKFLEVRRGTAVEDAKRLIETFLTVAFELTDPQKGLIMLIKG